jgi:hypothetical protein
MTDKSMVFKGRFQLWLYTIGHGRLLLRSTKSSERPTQIDILFKDVGVICLPASFDDPVIEVPVENYSLPVSVLGASDHRDRSLYQIKGRNVDGYVVAGAVAVDESEREYHEPSPLMDR